MLPGIHKCTEKEYPFVLWEWWVHVCLLCLVNQSITYYYIYRLSPGNITLLYAPMLSQKKQTWYGEDMHNYITWSKYHIAIIYFCPLVSIGWNKDANALLLYMESLLHKTFMRDNCIKFKLASSWKFFPFDNWSNKKLKSWHQVEWTKTKSSTFSTFNRTAIWKLVSGWNAVVNISEVYRIDYLFHWAMK